MEDKSGKTALYHAVKNGRIETFKALLSLGADPDSPSDLSDKVALGGGMEKSLSDLAFKYGEIMLIPAINLHDFVLDSNHLMAEVDGDTQLHRLIRDYEEGLAIMHIHSSIEDIKVKNSKGETPYALAQAFDFPKLMYIGWKNSARARSSLRAVKTAEHCFFTSTFSYKSDDESTKPRNAMYI